MTAVSSGDMADAQTPTTIRVRATVNLPGLHAGEVTYVDPTDPYMVDLIRTRLLDPLPDDSPGTDSEEAPTPTSESADTVTTHDSDPPREE